MKSFANKKNNLTDRPYIERGTLGKKKTEVQKFPLNRSDKPRRCEQHS